MVYVEWVENTQQCWEWVTFMTYLYLDQWQGKTISLHHMISMHSDTKQSILFKYHAYYSTMITNAHIMSMKCHSYHARQGTIGI